MSIRSEISRIQDAKNLLKGGIENTFQVSVSSSDRLDSYINYFPAIYPTPPTQNGVYIKYTDGSLSAYNSLSSGKTPVGVGLVTSNVSFVIHPNEVTGIKWGGYSTTITNCFTAYAIATAKTDFNGKMNTDAIISQLGAANAPGANWARNTCIYANGAVGWLPSCGEMEEIRLNASNVNTALSLIGGTQIGWSSHYYHSSTQVSAYDVWNWRNDQSKWTNLGKGYTSGYFRSVAAL